VLRRRLLLVMPAMLLAASCGGDEAEINRVEKVPVELTVTMKGDINVTFSETVSSNFIVRRLKTKEKEAGSDVLGTEPAEPVKYGEAAFLAGVAVVPFEGDGTYTIPVGSTVDMISSASGGAAPELGSSIKVDWWPTGDATGDPETFMRRDKPCEVVVKGKGTRGTLTCPDVTNEARSKRFSLVLSWVAPSTPTTTSTSSP
jgi:hypothetical protein